MVYSFLRIDSFFLHQYYEKDIGVFRTQSNI